MKDDEQVTEVTQSPAAFLQPHLEQGADRLAAATATPRTFFPGQTYADMSPERAQALELLTRIGETGGIGIEAGNASLIDMITNGILDPAALEASAGRAVGEAVNPLLLRSAGAGGGGSGLVAGAASRAGTEAFLDRMIPAQLREANLIQSAIGMTPALEGARTMPGTVLQNVGLQREAQEQMGIDEARARHEFGQNEELDRVMEYLQGLGVLGPMSGGTTTERFETTSSPLLQLAGAALSLGGMGSDTIAGGMAKKAGLF